MKTNLTNIYSINLNLKAILLVVLLGCMSCLLSSCANPIGRFEIVGEIDDMLIGHQATLLNDGNVLITDGNAYKDSAHCPGNGFGLVYNVQEKKITRSSTFSGARHHHTSTLLRNGKVLIAGGHSKACLQSLKTAYLYDPEKNTFQKTGDLNEARESHTATLLMDGRVLLTGGDHYENQGLGGGSTGLLKSTEIYDPKTGKFTKADNMAIPRAFHTATLIKNGNVIIIGSDSSRLIEIYNPSNGKFVSGGELIMKRKSMSTVLLNEETIVIIDGVTKPFRYSAKNKENDEKIIEIYNPRTKKTKTEGYLDKLRGQHTATRLNDGSIFIAGGLQERVWFLPVNCLDNAELYSPLQNKMIGSIKMSSSRAGHKAVLLKNGTVLIIGGYSYKDSKQVPVKKMELFLPAY
jgi:hypothetical protein